MLHENPFINVNPRKTCSCTTSIRCTCHKHSFESRRNWGNKQSWIFIKTLNNLKADGYFLYFGNFAIRNELSKQNHNRLRSNFLRKLGTLKRDKIHFTGILEVSKNDRTHYHFVTYSKTPIKKSEIRSLITLDKTNVVKPRSFYFEEIEQVEAVCKYVFKARLQDTNTPLLNEFAPLITFQTRNFHVTTKRKRYAQLIFESYGDQQKPEKKKVFSHQKSKTGFNPAQPEQSPSSSEFVYKIVGEQPESVAVALSTCKTIQKSVSGLELGRRRFHKRE